MHLHFQTKDQLIEFGNPIFDYDSGGSIPGADDGFNNGLTLLLGRLTHSTMEMANALSIQKNIEPNHI